MGQGLHMGLVFGVREGDPSWTAIDTPRDRRDDESTLILQFNAAVYKEVWKGYRRTSPNAEHARRSLECDRRELDYAYESAPRWCGFWIAVNDPWLANHHHGGAREIARTSFAPDDIPREFAAEIASAHERFDAFARFCRERGGGVAHVEGRVLLVSDWD